MAYEDAFAAVPGVAVEWCKYVGSYQGRLVAKLHILGEEGPKYILDYYGSCSGCDSYEAEIGMYKNPETGKYEDPPLEIIAAFGKTYVDAAVSLDEAIKALLPVPGKYYDTEDKEMLELILADYPEKKMLISVLPQGCA